MIRSHIKPRLSILSGSDTRLGQAVVERGVERPGTTDRGDGDGAAGPARHVLVLPTGPPRRLAWRDGGTERRATFSPGDVIVHPAGLETAPRWSGPAELLLFAAAPAMLDRVAQQVGRGARVELVPRYPVRDPLLRHLALALVAEFEHDGRPDLLYAESLSHALVAHLVKRYTVEGAAPPTVGRGLTAQALRRVTDYVGDRLGEPLALAEIAGLAGYSPAHFIDLFKRSTGRTPHQYVLDRRVEEARRRLAETDEPIAEIALQTGFSDQSHLTRTMRKRLGATPGAMRRA